MASDLLLASRTDMEDQWAFSLNKLHEEIKKAIQESPAKAVELISQHLEKQNNTPLNMAITGESGSGKSTFINAFRGLGDDDDGAAPTGVVETTVEVTPYPHPKFPNVTLWDLPGVGSPNFPADQYLKKVEFERFDFFIIITAGRFKENDVKLAQEIKKMGKNFYFLRSKIDSDLDNEKRKKDFNSVKTLENIKENCIKGLRQHGMEAPVFLVSSFYLNMCDFSLLQETLEKELPQHKRHAFMCALSNISMEIIKKKKDAYETQIKYHALMSSLGAAIPLPGVSAAIDMALLVRVVNQYVIGFELDKKSLEKLAESSGVEYSSLVSVMTSRLGVEPVTPELITGLLSKLTTEVALMAAEEATRFFPFLIPVSMVLSAVTNYRILKYLLELVSDDAQKVFEKALKITTEV